MTLEKSVGFGGANQSVDVLALKKLINQCIGFLKPRGPVVENGFCDTETIDAIKDFQLRIVKISVPDGRVDPGGKTWTVLIETVASTLPAPLFTSNPNEVSTRRTTPSSQEVVSMLLLSWTALGANGARTLAAQFMAETASGRFCFNWNLGNVKSGPDDTHMYLHNVWECDTDAGALAQVAKSGGLAHVATAEEIKQRGWNCTNAVVVFQPPHAQCRFRAYASLADGAQKWLGHHKSIALKNPGFLPSLNTGDTAAVAHALKLAGYYTAPEADYAKGMAAQKKKIDAELGPIR
ncbi:MAG: hypothetical protein ABJF23_06450 [Bryobacteraceae bacterium]